MRGRLKSEKQRKATHENEGAHLYRAHIAQKNGRERARLYFARIGAHAASNRAQSRTQCRLRKSARA